MKDSIPPNGLSSPIHICFARVTCDGTVQYQLTGVNSRTAVFQESVFTTRSSYEIENELHLHTVRNACRKMACCTECMPKDGMLYGMHAERR